MSDRMRTEYDPAAAGDEPSSGLDPSSWVDAHGDALFAFAMTRLRDREQAEDLVQETLLAAIESRSSFEGRSTLRTWLLGIMKNKLLQHRRRDDSVLLDTIERLPDEAGAGEFTAKGYWRTGPLQWRDASPNLPERAEFRAVLEACLRKLPPRAAEAFLLAERQGMSGEELSKILGISLTNVHVMLHRARSALRLCLERNWFRSDDRGGA